MWPYFRNFQALRRLRRLQQALKEVAGQRDPRIGYHFLSSPVGAFRMSFASVKSLVDDDLRAVDRVIRTRLASDVVLINQIADYIIGGGGKRLDRKSVV